MKTSYKNAMFSLPDIFWAVQHLSEFHSFSLCLYILSKDVHLVAYMTVIGSMVFVAI